MHVGFNLVGLLFLIAGVLGVLPIDGRAAWALVAIAGLLMLLGIA